VWAVVLVGGFGTRLRPLTLDTPKHLLPVGDRPLLEWVVGRLAKQGISRVVLSLGYRPDAFVDAYPDGRCADTDLAYAVEPDPLGTAGAVRFAAETIGIDDTFVVLNGDVLTDFDVRRLLDHHRRLGAAASIALQAVDDPSAFGVVELDEAGLVRRFVEKPSAGTAPSNLISAGTYVLEPAALSLIPAGQAVSIEREVFPVLAADGRLAGLADDGYWLDTGTPALLLTANLDVLDGRRGPIGETLRGDVDAGADVRRSVVSPGCRVAAGATVTDSVLLGGVSVCRGAVVSRSLIGPGVVIEPGAQVLDLSVIGRGERIRTGETLSGARRPAPN
jgi:mannose-1-phosphate guanylyltransferase